MKSSSRIAMLARSSCSGTQVATSRLYHPLQAAFDQFGAWSATRTYSNWKHACAGTIRGVKGRVPAVPNRYLWLYIPCLWRWALVSLPPAPWCVVCAPVMARGSRMPPPRGADGTRCIGLWPRAHDLPSYCTLKYPTCYCGSSTGHRSHACFLLLRL